MEFSTVFTTAEVQAFATGFPNLLLQLGISLGLLLVGAALYSLLSPWKEVRQIRDGNAAASVAFAGILLGLGLPLAASLGASASWREVALWGSAAVVVQLLLFRLTDLLLTGLPQRVREGEVTSAVLLVAARMSTALILAAALTG